MKNIKIIISKEKWWIMITSNNYFNSNLSYPPEAARGDLFFFLHTPVFAIMYSTYLQVILNYYNMFTIIYSTYFISKNTIMLLKNLRRLLHIFPNIFCQIRHKEAHRRHPTYTLSCVYFHLWLMAFDILRHSSIPSLANGWHANEWNITITL